jgi:threonine/homoserine/homoserine lactone efflux protein
MANMAGIINFESFLLASILLNLTPGNDTIFILSKSIGQGKKAGIISALGIGTGSVVHTILAAFGLSVILAKSIFIFNLVKYAGAIYLLFIGVKMLLEKADLKMTDSKESKYIGYWYIYRDAIFTNILNPKVALFFIAFLPQFINENLDHTVLPFLILGASFICTGTIWCLCLAVFASQIFRNLKASSSQFISKICGALLIGLAIKVALSARN